MFRFLTPRPGDRANPLQSQKTAAAWFRQLPAADTIGRSLEIVGALQRFVRTTAPADAACLAAIVHLDMELGPDRGQLIAQYVDRVDANPAVAERIWKAAYDISQAFIAAYRKLLDDAAAPAADIRLQGEIGRIIARLIHYFNADAKLRALKSERWIPQKWTELHRLYRRAVELGIDRAAPAGGAPGDPASRRTIEQEYVAVLLTHLVNAGTLAPSQIEWVLAQVHGWCGGLRLETAPTESCAFVVDPDSHRGLLRRGMADPGPASRYLDTTPMAAEIENALAALRPAPAGATSVHRQRITVLEKLRSMVAPDSAPTVSREPRNAVSYEADVRTGLAGICEALAAPDSRGRAAAAGARRDGRIPGAMPVDPSRAAHGTHAAKRPGELTVVPSWWVQNRSQSGLRITAVGAGSRPLALGTLVAVRPREGGEWALGVVRRMVRATSDKVDMGVSVIALRVSAVELHAKRQAREDMSFVVDGIDVSTIGERFDGLYLSPSSRPGKPRAEKSIVIPASEYAPGRSVVAFASQALYTIVLRELLERHGEWCWVAIEIAERQKRA